MPNLETCRSSAIAFAVSVAATLPSCAGGDGDEPRSVVLISLDTTRADALSCYGRYRGITPHLDALAAEGVLFERAYATAPLTLPSHASMLTGLYPPRHTVRLNSTQALPEAATTAAEIARERGYQTAAFVAAVVLDRGFGLAQGFERYDQPAAGERRAAHYAERPAAEVVDGALAWLASRDRERPFFVWVHVFDPHAPYQPPEKHLTQGLGNPYLAEVASMDAELGRFLDALRAEAAWEDALVVVVGDHGEGLSDHGEATHGGFAFESTLRVPLIVREPRRETAGGTRSLATRSVVDVFPTLVEAFGAQVPPGVDGETLRLERSRVRGVYFESYFGFSAQGWSPLAGWIEDGLKYVHSSRPELYDLARDPGEETNLIAHRSADAKLRERAIADVAAKPPLAGATVGGRGDLLAQLEDLGYVGASAGAPEMPHPLAANERPSPHERVAAFADFLRAQALIGARRYDEGLVLLRRIADENPFNPTVRMALGGVLLQTGSEAEAVEVLRAGLALNDRHPGIHRNLALSYEKLGQPEKALEHHEETVAIDPLRTDSLRRIVALCDELDLDREAKRYREILRLSLEHRAAEER